MRRGPMSSSAVADLSESRWTKADGGKTVVCLKNLNQKGFFKAKLCEKPRRGDAAEMAVIELV